MAWPSPGTKFWEAPARSSPMPVDVGGGSSSVQPRDSRSLDVVHFTAELAPIAKVREACRFIAYELYTWQSVRHAVVKWSVAAAWTSCTLLLSWHLLRR